MQIPKFIEDQHRVIDYKMLKCRKFLDFPNLTPEMDWALSITSNVHKVREIPRRKIDSDDRENSAHGWELNCMSWCSLMCKYVLLWVVFYEWVFMFWVSGIWHLVWYFGQFTLLPYTIAFSFKSWRLSNVLNSCEYPALSVFMSAITLACDVTLSAT